MASQVQIEYQGKLYPDFSFIQVEDQRVGPDLVYDVTIVNETVYTLENIRFVTNMPIEAYTVEHPKTIPENTKDSKLKVTIKTKELFEAQTPGLWDPIENKNQVMVALEYDRVRHFRR